MRTLVTLGPTHEPIDAVRFIGNRSSGRMGAAIVAAALDAGHAVTAITGPIAVPLDARATTHRVTTAQQMFDAVTREFPNHDLLVMAAAVADYRPKSATTAKLARGGPLTLELEPTPDIVAHVSATKRPDQRTVAFSLEAAGDVDRAAAKMRYKSVDLMAVNPLETMESAGVHATLLWPDGRSEALESMDKFAFARLLVTRAAALFM